MFLLFIGQDFMLNFFFCTGLVEDFGIEIVLAVSVVLYAGFRAMLEKILVNQVCGCRCGPHLQVP